MHPKSTSPLDNGDKTTSNHMNETTWINIHHSLTEQSNNALPILKLDSDDKV